MSFSVDQIKDLPLEDKFYSIKVRKYEYLGKPAIALYLKNVTKKLGQKFLAL